jgi:hypothetical protein
MEWIRRAGTAGPAALLVGLTLWFYRALNKATVFSVSLRGICKWTGQSATTARRGLQALEAASLISRTPMAGSKTRITLRPDAGVLPATMTEAEKHKRGDNHDNHGEDRQAAYRGKSAGY